MKVTTYSASCTTQNAPDAVLERAISILTGIGFAITQHDRDSVSFSGPGMNSTKQNPLVGASKIRLVFRADTITADAELGGVDTMQRFLMRFPFVLGPAIGLIFVVCGLVFGVRFGPAAVKDLKWIIFIMTLSIVPTLPWIVIAPLMSKYIRRRTQQAVTTFVDNIAFSPQSTSPSSFTR